MQKQSIIYWGTPDFAVPIFNALADAGMVVAVVTQPDKPKGKKRSILFPSPIKEAAGTHTIPVLQPETLRDVDFLNQLKAFSNATHVIVAYGKLIPQGVLDLSAQTPINVHPSLLPELRGPSPIQSALLEGRTETGVTLMQLDAEMDHGPILAQERCAIADDDTYETLSSRIADFTAQRIVGWVEAYLSGVLRPREQDHDSATFCKKITKADGVIHPDVDPVATVRNKIRALNPWPGVWLTIGSRRVRIHSAKTASERIDAGALVEQKKRLLLGCADGSIEILELQPDGKRCMSAREFLNGRPDGVASV